MSNVGLMSAEVVETNYSVRLLRTELMPESRGQGQFNGGMGLRRDYEILGSDARVTFYAEQTNADFAPEGREGGTPGRETRVWIIDPDGTMGAAATKASVLLPVGSILRVETSGGGGYGSPEKG
jgi:N-methylhydantoinase B